MFFIIELVVVFLIFLLCMYIGDKKYIKEKADNDYNKEVQKKLSETSYLNDNYVSAKSLFKTIENSGIEINFLGGKH